MARSPMYRAAERDHPAFDLGGRTLSRASRPIELLRRWIRATPAYMTLVCRLRSDA